MMRDANAHHSDDPAQRWSSLLDGVHGQRREAILKALRNSVASGYPANAEAVRTLVAYAQGQISARQYVARILETLGFIPAAYAPSAPQRQPEAWREAARATRSWREERPASRPASSPGLLDFNESRSQARAPERGGTTITQSRRTTRREAVQAYVNGEIPVEEFLRLSHGRSR